MQEPHETSGLCSSQSPKVLVPQSGDKVANTASLTPPKPQTNRDSSLPPWEIPQKSPGAPHPGRQIPVFESMVVSCSWVWVKSWVPRTMEGPSGPERAQWRERWGPHIMRGWLLGEQILHVSGTERGHCKRSDVSKWSHHLKRSVGVWG